VEVGVDQSRCDGPALEIHAPGGWPGQFEDLGVWQDARALSKLIYSVTKPREFYRDIDLRRQIRAAAVSAMSNIAEGDELGDTTTLRDPAIVDDLKHKADRALGRTT
jgi:hypothetical protein